MMSQVPLAPDVSFLDSGTNKAVTQPDAAEAEALANEHVRFTERGIVVYDHHALLNFRLYHLSNVYGTAIREQPREQGVIFTTILFGSILAIPISFFWTAGAIGILCISGVLALMLRLAVPSNHVLRITTPTGESDVLLSRDRGYVMRVFNALNAALADIQE